MRNIEAFMKKNGGMEKFQAAMADFAAEYLGPVVKARKAKTTLQRPEDATFSAIFEGFTEISAALDTLKLTSKLIGLAPPRSNSIRKDDYLKFLIGAYLQEMYILEQRLSSYAKKISRMYQIPTLPAFVQKLVYQPLEGLISTRGAHVHSRRYSDKQLDRLSTTALFESVGHELGEDLWFDYKWAQRHWMEQVKKNNDTTLKIVDSYFDVLHEVICSGSKVLWPPGRNPPQENAKK